MITQDREKHELIEHLEDMRRKLEKVSAKGISKQTDKHVCYTVCVLMYTVFYCLHHLFVWAEKDLSHVQEQLKKQTEITTKYKKKSKIRKSQVSSYYCNM